MNMLLQLYSCVVLTDEVAGEDEVPPNISRRLLAAKQARRLCAGHAHWYARPSLRHSQTGRTCRPEALHVLAQHRCVAGLPGRESYFV